MRFARWRGVLVLLVVLGLSGVAGQWTQTTRSASLSSVSVTLSNPRLSFRGALTSANSAGSSVVVINTTAGAYPSTSSAQLVEGDTVRIGETSSLGLYTVASTSSLSTFTIKSPDAATLASGDADSGDDVVSSQSASLTVRLTTTNAITNGRFRILVPSLTDNGAAADGIPDSSQFD